MFRRNLLAAGQLQSLYLCHHSGMNRQPKRNIMNNALKSVTQSILVSSAALALLLSPTLVEAAKNEGHQPPAFSEFDKDGDGAVSETEFNTTRAERHADMAKEGRPMKGMATAPSFADLDTDGDGSLNEAELVAGQKKHMQAMKKSGQKHKGKGRQQYGMASFEDIDTNGDGCIDAGELAGHHGAHHGKKDQQ